MQDQGGHRTEETAHFEIDVTRGSFADERAEEVGARLEALRDSAKQLLDWPLPEPDRSRIILTDVLLADVLVEPADSIGSQLGFARLAPERNEVWSVFSPDSPGIELDRSVLRLVVLRATGADLERAPLLWSGLLGLCGQRTRYAQARPSLSRDLVAANEGRPPNLNDALTGIGDEGPARRTAALAALTFMGFLSERDGPDRLRAFVVAVTSGESLDWAARSAYGTSLQKLERGWQKALVQSSTSAGGMGRFLRGSLRYLRPYWRQELVIFACLGVQLAFQQILPRAQALLIDKAILPRNLHYLGGLVIALFVLVVVSLLTSVLNDWFTSRVSESVLRTLRQQMFGQLQRLSHRFYSAMATGDIISRFGSDLRSVEQGLTSTLTQGSFLMLSLVISTIHILLLDWRLGVLVMLTLPLFTLTTRALGPRANRASRAYAQEQAAVTGVLQEDLAAQPVIKAYNLQPTMIERFRRQADILYRSAVRLFFLSSLFGVTANLLTTIVQVGVLALGGYFVIQGRLQLGSLIEFLALLGLVIGPVQSITSILQSVQVAAASMDRVEEILDAEPDVKDVAEAEVVGPVAEGIRFENVRFSYRGDEPQLAGVSLEIPAGKRVAIVGPSGSGKSTVINVLLRFYDPDTGRVLFDGRDIAKMTLQSLRQQIGVVFQDSFLFNTTVRENIRYGREDASDAEVEEAARLSEIHEGILQMPNGYDTVVGERGGNLSGGQRQRLAIARAILRHPSVLILDEATSALDVRTENAINRTLAGLSQGRTTITVTHRLAAASEADLIFVLDRGKLVEQGAHQELMDRHGLYQRLYDEQGVGGESASQLALQVAYLHSVPLFSELDNEALTQIAGLLRPEPAAAGSDIVRLGDQGDKFYLIVSGELDVLVRDDAGEERRLATLGSADYFGEMGLLRDVPRMATVRATTNAQLLVLSRDALGGLLAALPELRTKLESAMDVRDAAATTPR